jgi:hypothetical protein
MNTIPFVEHPSLEQLVEADHGARKIVTGE